MNLQVVEKQLPYSQAARGFPSPSSGRGPLFLPKPKLLGELGGLRLQPVPGQGPLFAQTGKLMGEENTTYSRSFGQQTVELILVCRPWPQ